MGDSERLPTGSRRDFLTGDVARRALLAAGERAGDALAEHLPAIPASGDTVRLETRAMACPWCVILNPGPSREVMAASDALNLVHEIEAELTIYRPESLISQVNREANLKSVPLPPHLVALISRAVELWKDTHGAFDLAAGKLIDLWRNCRAAGRIPDPTELAAGLAASGSQHVRITGNPSEIQLAAPVKLDFAAIGKGYAIDQIAAALEQNLVQNFLVHGGHSSLKASGSHNGHAGWPVGIRNPLFVDRPLATVMLRDEALSSSGSNIQYFRHAGRRYGHLLDPRTGMPAEGLLSVTVITKSAEQADALSTALYVMGLDKAQQYCDDHLQVGAILTPVPVSGGVLAPVIRNIDPDRLYFHSSPADRA